MLVGMLLVINSCGSKQSLDTFVPSPQNLQIEPGQIQVLYPHESSIQKFESLFSPLEVEDTGVSFVNVVDDEYPLSRLYILGYACGGIAVGDIGGWVDFVVSVNNGKMKLFKNNPDPSNQLNSLKVRLSYAQGNPNGVGSKVSVIMEDGTVQSDEVSAGGSYLSQSSPDLFFGVRLEKKIKSINVRWPDGKETVNELSLIHI